MARSKVILMSDFKRARVEERHVARKAARADKLRTLLSRGFLVGLAIETLTFGFLFAGAWLLHSYTTHLAATSGLSLIGAWVGYLVVGMVLIHFAVDRLIAVLILVLYVIAAVVVMLLYLPWLGIVMLLPFVLYWWRSL